MIKIKTPSADQAHLTIDKKTTLCGKKIYSYWEVVEDDTEVCMDCEIEYMYAEKENKENGKQSTTVESARADKRKNKLATW